MIVKSFKSYAMNIASDGSEDDPIHCFKPKQPCHAGCQQLKIFSQLKFYLKRCFLYTSFN